jgi:predicted acetyltransferase
MTETIRLVTGEELLASSFPLTAYAFQASPHQPDLDRWRDLATIATNRTHVLFDGDFDGGTALATCSVWDMTQNVRGALLPMGGVAGVATHPAARRGGRARRLLTHVLGDMRDQGQAVSALYPFRPSFYQRFGYVGIPQQRRVRLDPRDLTPLLRAEVPGTVRRLAMAEAAPEVRAFLERTVPGNHGMALRAAGPDHARLGSLEEWAALATAPGGEVTGILVYEIKAYGGELHARWFLHRDAAARTQLLAWVARHADQVATASLPLRPDEQPDTWLTDADLTVDARMAPLASPAPMVRILSVPALAGLPATTTAATVTVQVTDDLIGGTWTFASHAGTLEITPGGTPDAHLTAHGLAALVYGILDPTDLQWRAFGTASPAATATLRALFPRATPFLFEAF